MMPKREAILLIFKIWFETIHTKYDVELSKFIHFSDELIAQFSVSLNLNIENSLKLAKFSEISGK